MQTLKTRRAPYLVGVIGALLFVDLFLGWHRAGVSVSGIVDVHGDSSAWAGWGLFLVLATVVQFGRPVERHSGRLGLGVR
jgi:hypothetical protein